MKYERTVNYQPTYVNSGEADAYQLLSSKLQAFQGRLEQTRAQNAQIEGMKAGRLEGAKTKDVALPDGNSIRERAFRQGAQAAHMSALKLDVFQNLERIKMEAGTDPQIYQNKVAGYKEGLLEGATPDARPLIEQEIDFNSARVYSGLVEKQNEIARKEQSAQAELGLQITETEGLNAAEEGDEVGLQKSLDEYQTLLQASEEAGLIPPGESIKRMAKQMKELTAGVYMGEFGRSMESGKGAAYIAKFNKMKDKTFSPEERDNIVAKMLQKMNKVHSIETAGDKLENDKRKERYRQSEQTATTMLMDGTLTSDWLLEQVQEDNIDPGLARQLEKASKAKGVQYDDEAQVLEYSLDLLNFTEREIALDNTLKQETRLKLIEKRRKLEADTENWRRTQSGQEAVRRIKAEYGMVDGLIATLDPEKAKRAGNTLTALYNQIESLPVEQRALKAIDIADNLIKKITKQDKVDELKQIQTRIDKLPYKTLADIEAADIGSYEKQTQKETLQRLLNQIEQLKADINE